VRHEKEVLVLPTFVAHVEFHFEADRIEDGGKQLRDLAKAADRFGFDLKRGHIEPAPPDIDDDEDGWTGYGTRID
jgi:hypothetical protein